MGVNLGGMKAPDGDDTAAALYDRLGELIGNLTPTQQLSLVRAFQNGTPWSELAAPLRTVFRQAVE